MIYHNVTISYSISPLVVVEFVINNIKAIILTNLRRTILINLLFFTKNLITTEHELLYKFCEYMYLTIFRGIQGFPDFDVNLKRSDSIVLKVQKSKS